jgi:hypothetical protein
MGIDFRNESTLSFRRRQSLTPEPTWPSGHSLLRPPLGSRRRKDARRDGLPGSCPHGRALDYQRRGSRALRGTPNPGQKQTLAVAATDESKGSGG